MRSGCSFGSSVAYACAQSVVSAGRKYYTQREYDAQLAKQNGVCATPGCGSTGPFDADHEIPNAWEPGKPSQLLCKPCHKEKTARVDAPRIAKVNRIRKKLAGLTRKKRKINSPGFDKTKTKKLGTGKVVERKR